MDPNNFIMNFFTISAYNLNLFSFMLGMFYTLMGISTLGNPRRMWLHVVLYAVAVATYYYIKSTVK